MPPLTNSTGLTITNPLVLYRALIATQRIEADESQHRLAIHLQKLYYRLKDYEPALDYAHRLEQISSTVSRSRASTQQNGLPSKPSLLESLRQRKAESDSLALVQSMTSADAAMQMDSPKGLLLHGEVGTGKSMLVDLLATSLPTEKKKRWHFNAFMLDTFARLDKLRKDRARARNSTVAGEQANSLLLVARDLVQSSPIIFLDEFQLPDRASAKIMSSLFTAFFQLGGVLVATSNRMPEELAKAAGVEFALAPRTLLGFSSFRGLLRAVAGDERDNQEPQRNIFSGNADFAQFLDVLRARCETWNIGGEKDYRRREARKSTGSRQARAPITGFSQGTSPGEAVEDDVETGGAYLPPLYHVYDPLDSQSNEDWQSDVRSVVSESEKPQASASLWQPRTMHIYSRPLTIQETHGGIARCTFSSLCGTNLGPADYISIASAFHTLIITDVPVLTLLQKNEARRFITLLDALYEAHCRLLIRADAGPDEIFFPEISQKKPNASSPSSSGPAQKSQSSSPSTHQPLDSDDSDAVYAESFSDMYQDLTSPFRPNISSYSSPASAPTYTPSQLPSNPSIPTSQTSSHPPSAHPPPRSVLADEDADFGPVYGAGRSSGASSGSAAFTSSSSSSGSTTTTTTSSPNFQQTAQFTGADERFAFARARSRLWEMCGRRWWDERPGDAVESWWRPASAESRAWEGTRPPPSRDDSSSGLGMGLVGEEQGSAAAALEDAAVEAVGEGNEVGRRDGEVTGGGKGGAFPDGATSPFRTYHEPPPRIGWMHAWGMVKWGKKAGAWGEGVEGLGRRAGKNRGDGRDGSDAEEKKPPGKS